MRVQRGVNPGLKKRDLGTWRYSIATYGFWPDRTIILGPGEPLDDVTPAKVDQVGVPIF